MSTSEKTKAATGFVVTEQIYEDLVSELTLKFTACNDGSGGKLQILGDIPFGNRDIFFGPDGKINGTGTALA